MHVLYLLLIPSSSSGNAKTSIDNNTLIRDRSFLPYVGGSGPTGQSLRSFPRTPKLHMSSVENIRTTHSNVLTSTTNPSTQPRPVTPRSVPVVLNTETAMSADIMYRGEHRLLSGYADYTIAYKFPGEATKVSTSLVIVEAKRVGRLDSSYGQLVAYLGKL